MEAITQLLSYAATYPNAKIHYHKNIMVLHVHRDVSYLSAPKERSHVGRSFSFLDNTLYPANYKRNGPIDIIEKSSKCHGFSGRSRNRSHIRQQTGDHTHPNDSHQSKPPATRNPNKS